MGLTSVDIGDHPTPINILRVDGLSTEPPGWGVTMNISKTSKRK